MFRVCPTCDRPIAEENIKSAADLAKCSACDRLFRIGELRAAAIADSGVEQPAGSSLTYEGHGASSAAISIPRRGLVLAKLPLLAWSLFMCFGAVVWPLPLPFLLRSAIEELSDRGLPGAACFGLVFWLFGWLFGWCPGFVLLSVLLRSMSERQRIEIRHEEIVVCKSRLLWPWRRAIPYVTVDAIALESLEDPGWRFWMELVVMASGSAMLPTIRAAGRTVHFAEFATEPEMGWLVDILRSTASERAGKAL